MNQAAIDLMNRQVKQWYTKYSLNKNTKFANINTVIIDTDSFSQILEVKNVYKKDENITFKTSGEHEFRYNELMLIYPEKIEGEDEYFIAIAKAKKAVSDIKGLYVPLSIEELDSSLMRYVIMFAKETYKSFKEKQEPLINEIQ